MSEFEPTPLWTPSPDRVAGAEMTRFMGQVIDRQEWRSSTPLPGD